MVSKIKRTPEQQKRLDEWRKNIGKSLVDNLNKATKEEKKENTSKK